MTPTVDAAPKSGHSALPNVRAKALSLASWTKSYPLEELASGRNNNFNLLRFWAASLVIFSHCYAVAWGLNFEPVALHTAMLENGGSFGVLIFFAISGFLVTGSFVTRGGRLKTFLAARALRIYPALIVAVFFSAALAMFATNVSLHRFVTDHETRRFLLYNSLGYPTKYTLPGAFVGNPDERTVNGSLWTIPVEMEMYLVVAALGILGLYGSREWFNTFFAAFILLACTVKVTDLPIVYNPSAEVPRMAITFMFGALFFINRARLRLSIPWLLLFVAAIVHWYKLPDMRMFYLPVVAYGVLVLAYHPNLYFAAFNRLGDYSYGLYVYAFPVQQLLAYHFKGIKAKPLFLLAYPCILLAAVLSWHFIEKPMLKLKSR